MNTDSEIETRKKRTNAIKAEALRLGFSACGIAQARYLSEEAHKLNEWLADNFHADMQYMTRNIEMRLDPRLLVPGAKSVIVVLQNYFPDKQQTDSKSPVLAKYAYGEDYHFVLKDKLNDLHQFINNDIAPSNGRAFTDSAPILEKKWAQLAGLGWQGKNSNLLTTKGSFFFIGELILDLELNYDTPFLQNYCGTCTRCIEACPTQAITANKTVDARRCISYQTIENKGIIPSELSGKFENRVFGCDICQDVCPYNKHAIATSESRFYPRDRLLTLTEKQWHAIDETLFKQIFFKSAVNRTKYSGLRRNLDFLKSG